MIAGFGSIHVHGRRAAWLLASLGVLAGPGTASGGASTVPADFVDQRMASPLDEPVGIAEVPDPVTTRAPRVLIVEQRTARVRLVVEGAVTTLGTIPGVSSAQYERGLLGIAVDPAWPARPFLYVHYTDGRSGNHVAISRFTVTGDLGYTGAGALQFDPASRYDLLNDLSDDAGNHNGGTVRFGPDGALYVSLGDDATLCPAQAITFLGGKILRLDVSRLPATGAGPPPYALLIPPGNPFAAQPDSGAMLVWAYGLRNPFRFSIDAQTGDLYVADVGEGAWEEMSRVDIGGMNLGWPLFEGPAAFQSCAPAPPSTPVAPIYAYGHAQGSVIISGGLYRRPSVGSARFPLAYEGDCFLLDYTSGFLRRLKGSGTAWSIAASVPGQPSSTNWGTGFDSVSDMLAMSDGSLWYCRQSVDGGGVTGELRRIAYASPVAAPIAAASALAFEAPRPSPSIGTAGLRWSQAERGPVRLTIYDLRGRSVRTLRDGAAHAAGAHEQVWDGRDDSGASAGAGVYFARLQVGDARRLARITLLR